MPFRPEAGAGAPDPPGAGIPEGEPKPLVAAVVYPFHLFAPSGDSMAWYQLLPERHDRFTLRIHTCFQRKGVPDEADAPAGAGMHELTKAVHAQDIEACESVWTGLASPSFQSGRLSTLEKAIWQFNQWWAERMEVD